MELDDVIDDVIDIEPVVRSRGANGMGGALEQDATALRPTAPEPSNRNTALEPLVIFEKRLIEARPPILPFQGGAGITDQYRLIRTKIVQHPHQPRVVMVTSPGPGDGKTVSAINVAGILSLAQESKVLLIGGDVNSDVGALLGLPATSAGLSNLLSGECTLQQCVVRAVQYPNLHILPCGPARPDMPELLDSPTWEAVIKYARNHFRYVVIDAPPCGLVSDYYLLEAVSDAVAVIVRQDFTNRRMLKNVLLEIPKSKFVGVLVNCYEDWLLWKRPDYYGRPWE